MFEPNRLLELAGSAANHGIVDALAPALERLAEKYSVTTPLRRAHFLAQICHESAHFSRLVENLNYSAERIAQVWPRLAARSVELAHRPEALASAAYADRLGNGDEASRDGYLYRGRGALQLTGRDNYRAAGERIGLDLEKTPELAARPETAVEIALGFWRAHRCNDAADLDDVAEVTRLINGHALEGLEARRALTLRAKTIFADELLIA